MQQRQGQGQMGHAQSHKGACASGRTFPCTLAQCLPDMVMMQKGDIHVLPLLGPVWVQQWWWDAEIVNGPFTMHRADIASSAHF